MTYNTHVQRTLSALAIAGGLAASAWFGTAIGHADVFDQSEFPCAEDEVLGYDVRFGPERVGCIHIDELRDELTASATIEEDDPRWDCRTMGNLECGPGNAQGVAPGDYGDIDSAVLEYN